MTAALIVAVVLLAAFLQCLTGFGFAAIIMPLLTLLLGLHTAAPLVALAGLTVYSINLVRYRQSIDRGEASRLIAASIVGVPVGIWVLTSVDASAVSRVLGWLLVLYAVYALLRPRMARPLSRWWVYPAGFLAGCLGGAYNTPGPPVIVYGSQRQLPKDQYRAVLQALFFFNAAVVVTAHLLARNMTQQVFTYYLYALPALGIGIFAGVRVDRRVDPARFRILVSVMTLALGLLLVFGLGGNG
jgi:uncharacterized membrane protein YfcA